MREPLLFQNVSTLPQAGWVFVALPSSHMPAPDAGWLTDGAHNRFPWVKAEHGVYAMVSLAPGELVKVIDAGEKREVEPFAWHPSITTNLGAIVPTFFLGAVQAADPNVQLVSWSAAHQVWHLRTLFPVERITIDCWATVRSGASSVDYVVHAVYGDTRNDGQAQSRADLPALTMVTGSRSHIDFARRNGQNQPTYRADSKTWQAVLVTAGTRWHRASRFETRGAIMPLQDAARREGRPLCGLYMGWEGSWMATGKVPAATPDVPQLRAQQLNAYLNPSWGSYSDNRPRTQMQTSGTTGEQPDFGAASDLAVTALQPWEIHDALWQCQSFAQRPTANREPDGSPMRASNHPHAETLGQRPDLSYGERDRLGWPGINQIAWIPSPQSCLWTTSDDQHRADNFLHATYALTRDPALKAIIEDHVELDATDVYIKRRLGTAPRAVGRLALTRANQVWLGFPAAYNNLRIGLEAAIASAPLTSLPADRAVRTLGGYEEAKYGWLDAQGRPIRGWQGWQEAIAVIGLAAAVAVSEEYDRSNWLSCLEQVAQTVVENCWRTDTPQLQHAYAVRWNEGNQFPLSSWPTAFSGGDGATGDIYVTGACDYWTLAAVILRADDDELAAQIRSRYRPASNVAMARWWAL